MDEPTTGSALNKDEVQFETTLRPNKFDDYIGQDKTKRNLEIFIEAARMRGDALDHVLFYGPPGLGKTTLANIIASEMEANIKSTSGPVIEKSGDLAAILTNLKKGDILFIDEIHRLSNIIEEVEKFKFWIHLSIFIFYDINIIITIYIDILYYIIQYFHYTLSMP